MKKVVLRDLRLLLRQPVRRAIGNPTIRGFTANDFLRERNFHDSSIRRAVRPVLLADIGEGITECQVINWFVKAGDQIEQFDKLCEVQSDKASVEITSRWDGTIKKLHYDTDDMAVVGQPLVDIDVDEAEEDEPLTESAEREDVAGEMAAADMQQRAGPAAQTAEIVEPEAESPAVPLVASQASREPISNLLTPSVRHLLKELNLNVADIQGTGRNGRVMKEDVHRHHVAKSSPPSTSSNTESVPSTAGTQDRLVSLTATQNAMFKAMSYSLTIPHFLFSHSVDTTLLSSRRKHFNTNAALLNAQSPKLTALPFIMKALSHTFTQFPLLNSHLYTESNASKPHVVLKASHNFGIAVDTPQGLLVPVVKDVQNHSINSLAVEIERLCKLAREGKLSADDFKGATFMISNIGSIGGGVVSPVIVAPMVGILGVGRMTVVPAFAKDEMGVEKIIRREEVVLSWSADHRILDGATVAKCAEVVKILLEDVGVFTTLLR